MFFPALADARASACLGGTDVAIRMNWPHREASPTIVASRRPTRVASFQICAVDFSAS